MNSDPFDDLRKAWKQESAPLPPEDLQSVDFDTQQKVQALRAIWNAEECEHTPYLQELRRRLAKAQPKDSAHIPKLWSRAAAVALAAGLLIWFAMHQQTNERSEPNSSKGAQLAANTGETTPNTTDHGPLVEVEPSVAQIHNIAPEAITYRDDRIELVSGSVRLVLVEPSTSQTH